MGGNGLDCSALGLRARRRFAAGSLLGTYSSSSGDDSGSETGRFTALPPGHTLVLFNSKMFLKGHQLV